MIREPGSSTASAAVPESPISADEGPAALWRSIHSRHPKFFAAIVADAQITARYRGERAEFRSRLDAIVQAARLAWVSDAFLAQALYRAKARLQALGVPVLPRLAHRLAMATAQISIGDPVVIEAGVYIIHGQVVIDGLVEIGAGTTIAPFVAIGLRPGEYRGPSIETDVSVGTGSKVIGPVRVGAGATIGANSVVIGDVPPGVTVVGAGAFAVPWPDPS